MVPGGLRYLGKGQFGLAKDSVTERQNLMTQLKGLVDPLPFLMGHYKGGFPGPWIFDKLLAIYDMFAGKRYRRFVDTHVQDFLAPGVRAKGLLGMTRFMDAVTDDARLVMRVLQAGNASGGIALNYLKATGLMRSGSEFEGSQRVVGVYVQDQESGDEIPVKADAVINACGAWTDQLRQMLGNKKHIRPLRGSHIVVPYWRLPVAFSVSFFHPKDKRPVFAFPWEGQTVIGTTDLDHLGSLNNEASISQQELDYLIDGANHQFDHADISANDVLASWSGVRPVVVDAYADASDGDAEAELTKPSDEKREHMVWDDAGCISIAGGKLTTFRLLALEVLQAAQPYLKDKLHKNSLRQPTDFAFPHYDKSTLAKGLSEQRSQRFLGRYGSAYDAILQDANEEQLRLLGSSETCLKELLWACENESVVHLDDLFLRRVRVGMLQADGAKALLEPLAEPLRLALGWSDAKWADEWARYMSIVSKYYSVPLADDKKGTEKSAAMAGVA